MSGALPAGADREEAVRIALYLIRQQGVSERDVLRALDLQQTEHITFGEALFRLGLAKPEDLDAALGSNSSGLPEHAPPEGHAPVPPIGIRDLRTEILLRQGGSGPNCFAVLSAAPADGAALLTSALAVAFAQLNEPTLLIDADLRQPAQTQIFGLRSRQGLSEWLTSPQAVTSVEFSSVTGLPSLSVLGAGARPPNPQELLSSAAFSALITRMRGYFHHILVSTPDASTNADGLIAATAAGAALMVARVDRTPLPPLAELVRKLRAASVPILGSVLDATR